MNIIGPGQRRLFASLRVTADEPWITRMLQGVASVNAHELDGICPRVAKILLPANHAN